MRGAGRVGVHRSRVAGRRPWWRAWLTAVLLGSACYSAEAGPDPQFILAFALAIAATAAIAWAVGGHWKKRAVAFLLGLAAFGVGLIVLGLVAFWGFGEEVRIRLGIPRPAYAEFWGDLFGLMAAASPYQPPGSPIRYRLIGHGEMFRTRMAKLARDALALAAVASLPLGLIDRRA